MTRVFTSENAVGFNGVGPVMSTKKIDSIVVRDLNVDNGAGPGMLRASVVVEMREQRPNDHS